MTAIGRDALVVDRRLPRTTREILATRTESHIQLSRRVFITSSEMEALFGRPSRKATESATVSGARRFAAGLTPGIEATSSVSTAPGHSAVTRTPFSQPANFAAWLSARTACFVIA